MKQIIITWVYVLAPVIGVGFLMKYFIKVPEVDRWLKCWVLIVSVATITQNIWLIYLCIVFVSAKLVPRNFETRVFFFLALIFALPRLPYYLPFPGIQGLLVITYPVFLMFAFLITFYREVSQLDIKNNLLDKFVIAYIIYTTVLDFRGATAITQIARMIVNNYLTLWLPYWFLSRYPGDLRKLMIAIYMVGAALAFEAVMEWAMVWKAYTAIADNVDGTIFSPLRRAYHFRGLGLRISSSWLGPIPFGVFMSVVCFLALNVHRMGLKRGIFGFMIAAVALAATLFTDSRGALLTLVVALVIYSYYATTNRAWKTFFKVGGCAAVVVVGLNIDFFLKLDTTGTFQYRADLITYSADAFQSAPIFGDPNFRENEMLVTNMMQGQGIVDIVNHYLKVTLRYGLIGLVIYLGIWILAIGGVAKRASLLQQAGDSRYEAGALLVAVMSGVAFVIFTVSMISYLKDFVLILFALSSAYLKSTALEPSRR